MAQPVSLFAMRPLPEWIEEIQHADAAEDRYRALLAINSLGSDSIAIQWCRQGLRDVDSSVRALAAKQLGEWKRNCQGNASDVVWPEVAMELANGLSDDDPDVRFEAARALRRIDFAHAGARDVLLSFLDDDQTQPLMIAIVVSALSEFAEPDAESMIPRYRKLIKHDQAEVRENVSAAIMQLGTSADVMVPELIIALDDDEPIVRENAAIALGNGRKNIPEVLSALQMAETDDDEGVAAAARKAIATLSRV